MHNGLHVAGVWNNYEGLPDDYADRLDQLLARHLLLLEHHPCLELEHQLPHLFLFLREILRLNFEFLS
jgi:hypothetical protein